MWVGLVLHYRRALSLTYNASLFVYYTRLSHPPLIDSHTYAEPVYKFVGIFVNFFQTLIGNLQYLIELSLLNLIFVDDLIVQSVF